MLIWIFQRWYYVGCDKVVKHLSCDCHEGCCLGLGWRCLVNIKEIRLMYLHVEDRGNNNKGFLFRGRRSRRDAGLVGWLVFNGSFTPFWTWYTTQRSVGLGYIVGFFNVRMPSFPGDRDSEFDQEKRRSRVLDNLDTRSGTAAHRFGPGGRHSEPS